MALVANPQRFDSCYLSFFFTRFHCTKSSRRSFLPYFEYSIEKSGRRKIWDKGTHVVGRKYCPAQRALLASPSPYLSIILRRTLALLGIGL